MLEWLKLQIVNVCNELRRQTWIKNGKYYMQKCVGFKVKKVVKIYESWICSRTLIITNGNIYSGVSLANLCVVGLCAERNAIEQC